MHYYVTLFKWTSSRNNGGQVIDMILFEQALRVKTWMKIYGNLYLTSYAIMLS